MAKLKTLALAAVAVVLAGGVAAVEEVTPQKPLLQSLQRTSVSEGEFRLSQTATCIYNGQRYSKGARICLNGFYNYCNSRGLWEPSNLTC